jgi:hypothetical protein
VPSPAPSVLTKEQLACLTEAQLATHIVHCLDVCPPKVAIFLRKLVNEGMAIETAAEEADIKNPHLWLAHRDSSPLHLALMEQARRSSGVTPGMLSAKLLRVAERADKDGKFRDSIEALKTLAVVNGIGKGEAPAIASPISINIDLSRAGDGAEEEQERRLALGRRTIEVREAKEIHGTTTRRPRDVIQQAIDTARAALPPPPEELN